jgi:hypothetical protein
MSGMAPVVTAVWAVWNEKALWAIHVVANAVFAVLIYEWLWIPDRTIPHLALSAISGLAIVGLILWLHAGTLAHFRAAHTGEERRLSSTFRTALHRLLPFSIWALILAFVMWSTFQLETYRTPAANWTASFLSLNLRVPVAPATVSSVFHWAIMLLALVVVPMLLLPLGSSAAREGFRSFAWRNAKKSIRVAKRLRYWAAFGVFLILGAVIPYQLVWWIPEVDGLYPETASLVVRFLLAYVLAVTSWLLMASMAGTWGNTEKDGPL